MRSISHWTPYYIAARIREVVDHKLNPTHPWLTRDCVRLMKELLRREDLALEFGSGRSTLWIAKHVKHLISVESDAGWHQRGIQKIAAEKLINVELLYVPVEPPGADEATARYVRVLDRFDEASLDFCLVDGMYRNHCALGVLPKLKAGGLLIVDNVGWFLPSNSRTPSAIPINGQAMDAHWTKFMSATQGWRKIWTTSGVTDTLLLFKP